MSAEEASDCSAQNEAVENTSVTGRIFSNDPAVHEGTKYVSMVDYKAAGPKQLTLFIGDVIRQVVQEDDEWLRGTLKRNGQTGNFPARIAEKLSI
ncbi:LIM and SH3 domain protein 1-like [Clavelina lepadiformis]|uniref:LIM and SH3 domain protein 1-like n=1 Tax=Clavelina lepadiformis TaxID=159417 RepID=UPI0040428BD6